MRSSASGFTGSRRAPPCRQTLRQDPARNGAGAGKDPLHGLAGSHHNVADRRHGPPDVALGLHYHRLLRMNDDMTALFL
jgi:hypothetical protein